MEENNKSNQAEPTSYTQRSLFLEDEFLESMTGCNVENEVLEPTSGCNVDEEVLEPTIGMVFKTEAELIEYYKKYGKQVGFGIMTQRSKRDQDGSVRYVTLGFARGGKARNRSTNLANPRPTTKTDCKARINAILVGELLRINTIENAHNHGLSPRKARFFRCNRAIDDSVKRQLDINDKAGISMAKSFNALVVEAGGFDKLPFIEKDARNYIDKARHLRLGKGGAAALRDYFVRMQYKNEGFYSLMDLDDDGRLENVFLADARSRAAYGYFEDVVTFDTTYLTNRYDMPFAPFVGVNHHGQSILLGAGLISSENTETFIWLFETWLKCMDGRAPKAIITDQDRAMKKAIEIVFPNTRHRYCLWHIMRKLPEKLGSHFQYNCGLKTALHKCIYDCQTPDEFEVSWEVFLDTYNLHEHVWLQSLYSERMYWIPVYLKDTFWAGMSTTHRSESMNAFFDGFVHSGTTLKEFVDQFDNALRKKVENEMAADFHSFNCTIPCITHLPVEKQIQELYTNSKCKELQSQILRIIYSHCILIKTEGTISTYQVNDQLQIEDSIKRVTYQVYFNEDECEAKCMCGLFEMRGILCSHILAIFSVRDVRVLPSKYIMDRWRKDIKRRYALIRSSYDDLSGKPAASRYSMLIRLCYEVATNAAKCDDNATDMAQKLQAMNLQYTKMKTQPALAQANTEGHDVEIGSSKYVLSPRVVRGKGRPPSKRRAHPIEKIIGKRRTKNNQSDAGENRKRRNAKKQMEDDKITSGLTDFTEVVLVPNSQQSVISQIDEVLRMDPQHHDQHAQLMN